MGPLQLADEGVLQALLLGAQELVLRTLPNDLTVTNLPAFAQPSQVRVSFSAFLKGGVVEIQG